MKKLQFGLAMLLSVLIISCSDDDDPKKDQGIGDGPVTQQDTGPTQQDTGPTQQDIGPVADGPVATGACINKADGMLLASEELRDAITAAAQTCGLGCLSNADPASCSQTCVATETGLSAECSACYAGIILCSIENCIAACGADPTSEACATCQQENCLPDFFACSGLAPAQ